MIVLKYTAEVRWFFRGELPRGILDWFTGDSPLPHERLRNAPRTDRYIVLPGSATVGVKFREGKLEVKALRTPPQPVQFRGGVQGRSDAWIKWTCDRPSVGALFDDLNAEPERWVDVEKERWLRRCSIDSHGWREIDAGTTPEAGCDIEVTGISVSETPWWTLALESFGPGGRVAANLQSFAEGFFSRTAPPVTLDETHSWSYPGWLFHLVQKG